MRLHKRVGRGYRGYEIRVLKGDSEDTVCLMLVRPPPPCWMFGICSGIHCIPRLIAHSRPCARPHCVGKRLPRARGLECFARIESISIISRYVSSWLMRDSVYLSPLPLVSLTSAMSFKTRLPLLKAWVSHCLGSLLRLCQASQVEVRTARGQPRRCFWLCTQDKPNLMRITIRKLVGTKSPCMKRAYC